MNLQSVYVFLTLNLVYQIRGKRITVIVGSIFVIVWVRSVHSFTYVAQCQNGDIQLTGGPNKLEGRVELCVNGNWGQVCVMPGWTNHDAQVVCRQLGHTVGCELLII